MEIERESFVFYKSWYKAIGNLPRDVQGEVLTAIIEYGLSGVTTEQLKPTTRAMMELIKPQIDANRTRFENGCKGAEFGKLGGRPRKPQNNPNETPEKPQNNPNETPNVYVDVNDNVNVDDDVNGDDANFTTTTDFKNFYSTLKLPKYDVLTKQQEQELSEVCKKYRKNELFAFLKKLAQRSEQNKKFKPKLPYILKNFDAFMQEFLQQAKEEERVRKRHEEEEDARRRAEAEEAKRPKMTRAEYMKMANEQCKLLCITYDEYLNLDPEEIKKRLSELN